MDLSSSALSWGGRGACLPTCLNLFSVQPLPLGCSIHHPQLPSSLNLGFPAGKPKPQPAARALLPRAAMSVPSPKAGGELGLSAPPRWRATAPTSTGCRPPGTFGPVQKKRCAANLSSPSPPMPSGGSSPPPRGRNPAACAPSRSSAGGWHLKAGREGGGQGALGWRGNAEHPLCGRPVPTSEGQSHGMQGRNHSLLRDCIGNNGSGNAWVPAESQA